MKYEEQTKRKISLLLTQSNETSKAQYIYTVARVSHLTSPLKAPQLHIHQVFSQTTQLRETETLKVSDSEICLT